MVLGSGETKNSSICWEKLRTAIYINFSQGSIWDHCEVPRLSRSMLGHKMLFIFLPSDHLDVGWRVPGWHVENGHRDTHTTKRPQISVGSLQQPVPNLRMLVSHPSWPGHRAAAFHSHSLTLSHCTTPPFCSWCRDLSDSRGKRKLLIFRKKKEKNLTIFSNWHPR